MIDTAWLKIVGPTDVSGDMTCETVRVVRPDAPGGFCEINASDLTDDMVLYTEK